MLQASKQGYRLKLRIFKDFCPKKINSDMMQYDPAAAAASFILNYSRAEVTVQTHMSHVVDPGLNGVTN
jgi:hypothetical protein